MTDPAQRAVAALLAAGKTVATAESCTGGLIGKRITDIAGSSAAYPGGFIAYSDFAKRELLGVPAALLEREGAVSEPVARELAERVRAKMQTTYGVGVTGLAGPDPDGSGKPVGLIYVSVSDGTQTACRELHLNGNRQENRQSAADTAFLMLLELL
jgi:nicotinamide-nucleotide amidase